MEPPGALLPASHLETWSRRLAENLTGAAAQLRSDLVGLLPGISGEREQHLLALGPGGLKPSLGDGSPKDAVTPQQDVLERGRRLRRLVQDDARARLAVLLLDEVLPDLPTPEDVVWSVNRACLQLRRLQERAEHEVPIGVRMEGPAALLVAALPPGFLSSIGAHPQVPRGALATAWKGAVRPVAAHGEQDGPTVEVEDPWGRERRFALIPDDLEVLVEGFHTFQLAVPSGRTPYPVAPRSLSDEQWEVFVQLVGEGAARDRARELACLLA